MTAIHQFVPSFAARDAIGSHTLQVQRVLRDLGLESEIFSADAHAEVKDRAQHFRRYRGRPGQPTWLLYQLSTGSELADFLRARPEPTIVDYHNITPTEFYAPWEPHAAHTCALGRHQLPMLAPKTDLALADSAYNAQELSEVGYRDPTVVPILLDTDEFDREVDPAALARFEREREAGGSDWLFVGRIVPNKAQHDLVKAFSVYRRVYDPQARLTFVGGISSHAYNHALASFVEALGLGDAVRLAGSVPMGELAARYATADLFVCLSDHEGFCVPLLEAMHHRIPILAYESSAVTETLAGAGVLLADKSPTSVAAAAHRILDDPALRVRLREAGLRRLEDFHLSRTEAALRRAVTGLLEAA